MVVPSDTSVVVADPSLQRFSEADRQATSASIARYLASGERVRGLTDLGFKVCIVLAVLLALAWAFGLLPGATKLF